MTEAEAAVRNQMKNRKGTELFAHSTRVATFNKLMGLSTAPAYRQPAIFPKNGSEKQGAQSKSMSAEGKFDLSKFNG